MKMEIIVPTLPESIVEATVAKILRKKGDYLRKNDTVIDLETDKIMLSITAQENGTLESILVSEGETVKADQVIAIVNPKEKEPQEKYKKETNKVEAKRYGPSVRKAIIERDINVADIKGSGKKGRIHKLDLNTEIGSKSIQESTNSKKDPEQESKRKDIKTELIEGHIERDSIKEISALINKDNRNSEEIPLSKIRLGIIKNLLQSQNNSILLNVFDEVDMSNIVNIRKLYRDKFLSSHNIRLGFAAFFTKAVSQAFKSFPIINSSTREGKMVYYKRSDIGITISTPSGVVTPVVRGVDNIGIAEIEKRIFAFSEQAKNGSINVADMKNGTFTINNSISSGPVSSTSIVNFPQNAILNTHRITDRAYIIEGEVKIRPIMNISLSYNYCVVDNKSSVGFLSKVKELLENPCLLMLDV